MQDPFIKVRLHVEPSDMHDYSSETLWAESIGNDLYILKNTPLYAKGYGYLDTILAVSQWDDAIPTVKKVVRRSGHSTYWIIRYALTTEEQFENYWKPLKDIGCTFEGMVEYYFAVDIPPETDVETAYNLMKRGEEDRIWTFAEGFNARDGG